MNNYAFLGIVRNGKFMPLVSEQPAEGWFRLTTVPIQATQPPESGEIPLATYESSAIMVRGISEGEWIRSAVVVEQAGPILTVVVQVLFSRPIDPSSNLQFPIG